MKKILYIYTGTVTVLLIILGVIVCSSNSAEQPETEEVITVTATALERAVQQAGDLTTTRYYYTDIGKYENSLEMNGWTIPFTQKNFILTYRGMAAIGIDCQKIHIKTQGNKIEVICPSLELLSNTIEEDSIEIYDENTNLFNPISISDYSKFAAAKKEETYREIMQTEIWQQAHDNTRQALKSLLSLMPGTEGMEIEIIINEEM